MQYQCWCVEIELHRRIVLKFAVGTVIHIKIFEVWHVGDRDLRVPIRPKQLKRSGGELLEHGLATHQ